MEKNPYQWRARKPEVRIRHPLVEKLARGLLRGELYKVVGGHGMGKTVLLGQIADEIDRDNAEVVFIRSKPHGPCTVDACMAQLAQHIGIEWDGNDALEALIARWFDGSDGRALILLYDEIDRYVEDGSSAARDFLDALAGVNGDFPGQLGVAIAGGLGVYKLESHLGSNFGSRAVRAPLEPFDVENIATLTGPFQDRGQPLSSETLDALRLLSGGIPALVIYGLEGLWESGASPEPDSVAAVFQRFLDEVEGFENAVYRGLGVGGAEGRHINALWQHFNGWAGPHSRARLIDLVARHGGTELDLEHSVRLLRASGLIRIHGTEKANPLVAESVPSIFRPLDDSEPLLHATPVEQLRADLFRVLALIARWGMDFFQGKKKTDLVPESVFSAFLGTFLWLSGWVHVEREPQQGPGFVDLVLSHPRFPDMRNAVIEVKIWSRNDDKEVHRQVVGYCQGGPPAEQCAAVVMIASRSKVDDWPDDYRAKCLGGCDVEPFQVEPPVTAAFTATASGGAGAGVEVTHVLLNLPRRAHR